MTRDAQSMLKPGDPAAPATRDDQKTAKFKALMCVFWGGGGRGCKLFEKNARDMC